MMWVIRILFPKSFGALIQGRKQGIAGMNGKGPGPFLSAEATSWGARGSSKNCLILCTVGTFPLWYPSEAISWDFRKKEGAVVSSGEILNFGKFFGEDSGGQSYCCRGEKHNKVVLSSPPKTPSSFCGLSPSSSFKLILINNSIFITKSERWVEISTQWPKTAFLSPTT